MTLKRYLLMMIVTTLVCWASFVLVLFRIDPSTAGTIGLTLFFVSLFFALWGTLALIGFWIRLLIKRQSIPFEHIGISLRQSLWFAVLVSLSLLLVSQDIYVWWMSLLLVIGMTVAEGFFLARTLEPRYHQKKSLRRTPR